MYRLLFNVYLQLRPLDQESSVQINTLRNFDDDLADMFLRLQICKRVLGFIEGESFVNHRFRFFRIGIHHAKHVLESVSRSDDTYLRLKKMLTGPQNR